MKTYWNAGIFFRIVIIFALVFLLITISINPNTQAFAKQPFQLIYLDAHTHSLYSDGSGSVADIKATAISRGLSAVVISDHCKSLTLSEWNALVSETQAASSSTFLALPGVEMTGSEGIFNRDHILALAIEDPFVGEDAQELCPEEVWTSPVNPNGTGPLYPENLAQWTKFIHSQGGIAVHNHPSGTTKLAYGVDSLEVYNQGHIDDIAGYAAALGFPPEQAWQLGLTINNFALYGERDANMLVPFPGFPTPVPLRYALWYATGYYVPPYIGQWLGAPEAPLSSWDQLLMAYVDSSVEEPIFAMANSDSHNTGAADSTVGLAKNGLYVKNLTAKDVYKAIKAGRSFSTTGPSLVFTVNGEQMGETVTVTDGSAKIFLSVYSENTSAILVKIDFIKNGEIWYSINPGTMSYATTLTDIPVTEDGYYRIEVTSLDTSNGKYYFAWSNPVFVDVY